MGCKRCDELLKAYRDSARLFLDAERSSHKLVGEEFQGALEKLQRLHGEWQSANDALTVHWREDHSTLTKA